MPTILPLMDNWLLFGLGFLLMLAELVTFTFVLLYFGLGFLLAGLLGLVIVYPAGEYQFLAGLFFGVLLFLLNRRQREAFLNKEKVEIDAFVTGGIGTLIESNGKLRVQYKGTSWPIMDLPAGVDVGDRVSVIELVDNIATIEPYKPRSQ